MVWDERRGKIETLSLLFFCDAGTLLKIIVEILPKYLIQYVAIGITQLNAEKQPIKKLRITSKKSLGHRDLKAQLMSS